MTGAETAYHKAIEADKAVENWLSASKGYYNLAEMLYTQGQRLDDAKKIAEAGLAIDKTLDPNVAEIKKTYALLAKIAEKQNDATQAQSYQRLVRKTTDNDLQAHQQFVDAVVQTIAEPKLKKQLDTMLQQRDKKGWGRLVTATRQVLDGERDFDKLCQNCELDSTDSLIVGKILQEIEK